MNDVWVIAAFGTAFSRRPDDSIKDLARETYAGVLADTTLGDLKDIGTAWFGNCLMHTWGQPGIQIGRAHV